MSPVMRIVEAFKEEVPSAWVVTELEKVAEPVAMLEISRLPWGFVIAVELRVRKAAVGA